MKMLYAFGLSRIGLAPFAKAIGRPLQRKDILSDERPMAPILWISLLDLRI